MDREHRQRLKRGSKWERTEKCAQQAPSVFSSRLLWPQPHFLNCQWLFGTIYIHQSQGLSYLFCLLSPLFLFVFVSFLTVRYLSSMPVLCSLLNGLDGLEAQWTACDPSDQSSFMHRLSLLFCFCLSVRAEGGKDHFIEKEATNLLHWDVGKFIRHSQTAINIIFWPLKSETGRKILSLATKQRDGLLLKWFSNCGASITDGI